ncbi:MAG: SDR family oxidoreductase [Flavobacteriales bacterium]
MDAVMNITNSDILVTGGAGFIGSNLCEALLSQGNRVTCMDNFATGKIENIAHLLKDDNFALSEGDIRNIDNCRKAVEGCTLVLHQAALGSVPRSVDDPLTTNEVNVSGSLNMLWAAKQAGVKRFVYASSSSTYGDSTDKPSVEENTGFPLSPYAVSKCANELYAGVFAKLYGMETIGLRYFNVFGPRQDPAGAYAAAIPRFIRALMDGKAPVIYGDGTQTRDFTYVENVVQANQLAALTTNPKAIGKVYNIACGQRIELNAVVQMIKSELTEHLPDLARIEPQYTEERPGEVKHSLASVSRAKELLNYHPHFDFQRGLKHYIAWFLRQEKIG